MDQHDDAFAAAHAQRGALLATLQERKQTKLQEAMDAMTQYNTLDPPRQAAETAYKEYVATGAERERQFNEAQVAADEATRNLERFNNPAQPATPRYARLPTKSFLKAFVASAATTPRDCIIYIDHIENACNAGGVPFNDNGSYRWYEVVRLSFEKGAGERPLSTDISTWIKDQQAIHDWTAFKKAFKEKFVRDTTNTSAQLQFEECFHSPNVGVETFSFEFMEKALAASFSNGDAPANWKTMPVFSNEYTSRLQPGVHTIMLEQGLKYKNALKSLDDVIALSIECEELIELRKRENKAYNIKRVGKGEKRKEKEPRQNKGDNPKGSTKKFKKRGSGSQLLDQRCKRCGRGNHDARECFAMKDKSGKPLDNRSRVTTNLPDYFQDGNFKGGNPKRQQHKCANCGSLSHTTASCPRQAWQKKQTLQIKKLKRQLKQQKRKQPPTKRQRREDNSGGRDFPPLGGESSDDSESSSDDNDEDEDEQ
jgi:hypothetical protein